MIFELAQNDVQNTLGVLPLGNGLSDLVDQTDAGELLLQGGFSALSLGYFRLQFTGALVDTPLEVGISLLNLLQHVIKTLNQLPELVVALFARANRIILCARDRARRF